MKNLRSKKDIKYLEILNNCLEKPGIISGCYSLFHNYSFYNIALACEQMYKAEPINSFSGWNKLGRKVKKGAKAIELCMPIIIKETKNNEEDNKNEEETKTIIGFMFKKNWFKLSDTEEQKEITEKQKQAQNEFFNKINNKKINIEKLTSHFNIKKVDFEEVNGNVQGYAYKNNYAINPLAEHPLKTTFHEIAHILLGHTTQENSYNILAKSIKEVEAEGTAYLILTLLGEQEEVLKKSRGYIQGYFQNINDNEKIDIFKNIIKTTDLILKNM